MTTEEAVALRKNLEHDLLALLQNYRDATGLTPVAVDVQRADIEPFGGNRSIAITGVRVTVEV